jgi:hypothetical protein
VYVGFREWWDIREALDQAEFADLDEVLAIDGLDGGYSTHNLAALVLDVLLGLVELVSGGILCEGDLGRLVRYTSSRVERRYIKLRHGEVWLCGISR